MNNRFERKWAEFKKPEGWETLPPIVKDYLRTCFTLGAVSVLEDLGAAKAPDEFAEIMADYMRSAQAEIVVNMLAKAKHSTT